MAVYTTAGEALSPPFAPSVLTVPGTVKTTDRISATSRLFTVPGTVRERK